MLRVEAIGEMSREYSSTRGQQSPKSDCSLKQQRDDRMRRWLSGFEAVPGPRPLDCLGPIRASPGGPLSPTPPRHTKNSPVLSDEFHGAQPNGQLALKETALRSSQVLADARDRRAMLATPVRRPESSSRQPGRPRLDLAAPDPRDAARNVVRFINTSSVVKTQMLEHAQLLELLQTAVISGHVVLVGAEEKWDPGPQKYLSSVTAAVAQHKTAFVALFRGWL